MANRSVSSTNEEPSVIPRMLLLDGLRKPSKNDNISEVSPILARIRDFLPQIAAANEALSNVQRHSSSIDILNVQDDELSDQSDTESGIKRRGTDQPYIEVDVSVYKDCNKDSSCSSDSSSSEDPEVESELPEAFRTSRKDEGVDSAVKRQTTRKRKLIEEVEEG
uniref:Peptidase S9 prolyl oligopeptidase catalytic domain-containing protein n=1 Tax=Parascaris univalens TaxID=6257 RepID=A0A915AU35_PARUN